MVARRSQQAAVKSEPSDVMSSMSEAGATVDHPAHSLANDGMAENHESPPDDSGYSSHSEANGFSSDTIEALGRKTSSLISAINQLEQAGVEASGLPLPKIVAIGDQSSGKSSLIEAISEIRVPRAANTCTRCPLQISMSTGPTSSWKITVHQKYSYSPQRLSQTQPASASKDDFGPWHLLDRPEDVATRHIASESDIESMIARAQVAILTPSDNPDSILRGAAPSRPGLEFSPNVIKLDIVGPNLPALTLYDLPGIITQSTSNDDTLPGLIRMLARHYIEPDNTIVMLACPIGTDHVNSNAARLVKDLNAASRCIGVITKPDKLDMSDHVQWAEMLSGQKFALQHGYFVTKQPGADEMLQTHAQAREAEKAFFGKDKRWTSRQLAPFQDRYGTPKLQEKLSELLAREIEKALPNIRRRITDRISSLERELENFPKPHSSPLNIIHQVLGRIDRQVEDLMRAKNQKKQFLLDWKNHREAYWQTMKGMKPVVVVTNTNEEEQWHFNGTYADAINLDSDDEGATPCPPSSGGSKRHMPSVPHTPNKRQRATPSTAPRNGTSRSKRAAPSSLHEYPQADLGNDEELAQKFRLQGIRQVIRDEAISGIPRATDPEAEDSLIKKALSDWDVPLGVLFEGMSLSLKNHLDEVAIAFLQEWANTPLYARTREAMLALVEQKCASCQQHAKQYLAAKLHNPFTLNKEVLAYHREQELDTIREHRREARAKAYVTKRDGLSLKRNHSEQERKEFAYEVARKASVVKDVDLGADPFHAEVAVMADVRAYYNLAAGNMVDSICEMVHFEVFDACALELRDHLMEQLGLNEENPVGNAKSLLVEDPARLAQREAMEKERDKLKEAKTVIDGLKA